MPSIRPPSVAMLEAYLAELARHAEGLESARQRAMIGVVIRHLRAELIDFDIEAAMATLHPASRFYFYGMGPGAPVLDSPETIRAFYLQGFKAGPGQIALTDIRRITIGDHAVAIESTVVTTPALVMQKFPGLAAIVDAGRPCVVTKDVCAVLPFRDGLMDGETIYYDGPYGPQDVRYLD